MRNLILPFAFIAMMSCGGGESDSESDELTGTALATAVCDCHKNANAMDSSDPNRSAEQTKCGDLNMTNYKLVEGTDQEASFNDGIANCEAF